MISIKTTTDYPSAILPLLIETYGGIIQQVQEHTIEFRCDSFKESRKILKAINKD